MMRNAFTGSASTMALAALAGLAATAAADCWDTSIANPGAGPTGRQVTAFATHGGQLFAGGTFTEFDNAPINRIARWDGGAWWPLGDGITNDGSFSDSLTRVRALTTFNGDLIAGGRWTHAGGVSASRIARWDGELWHALGSGLQGAGMHPSLIEVNDMIVWDDGIVGPSLYVGGNFSSAGNASNTRNFARWDGTSWSAVGGGITCGTFTSCHVSALGVFDGHLFLGGNFRTAGGSPHEWFVRWDGNTWKDLPGYTVAGQFNHTSITETFTTFDDGSGEAIYWANGAGVWRYDGTQTVNIGGNLMGGWFDAAYSLAFYNDGTGYSLYAGGYFDGNEALQRWNGDIANPAWSPVTPSTVAGGSQPYVGGLHIHDDKLIVGGRFEYVGGDPTRVAHSIAIWDCNQAQPCYADCDGNEVLNIDDFLCFINEFAQAQALPTAQQIEHYANCDGSTTEPVLTIDDFLCFINEFSQGCP